MFKKSCVIFASKRILVIGDLVLDQFVWAGFPYFSRGAGSSRGGHP